MLPVTSGSPAAVASANGRIGPGEAIGRDRWRVEAMASLGCWTHPNSLQHLTAVHALAPAMLDDHPQKLTMHDCHTPNR